MKISSKNRLLKPLGFIISGFIGFVATLVGYILTAIDSYYDDGFGQSISYGSKDLLMLAIVSFLVTLFGIYLLTNYFQKKKEIDYLPAMFTGLLSFIVLVFFVSYIFKPVIKGEVSVNTPYIMMIVGAVLGIVATILASILLFNHLKKKTSYYSFIFSYLIFICYCLEISLYAIAKGISLSGNGIAICYYVLVFSELLELLSSIFTNVDERLR